ncbi:MAG: MGMT family protein [Bacteroidales bacterium]|nr:MGMT family protein [Bacteroidales bacterium]
MKTNAKLDKEEFRDHVFQIVSLIPEGRATSYGIIARAIGYPKLSRMVGRVLANSTANCIPAHRVVSSQGILSGKDAFETPTIMQELLESEGIIVENNRIKNWKRIVWDPLEEFPFDDELL